MTIWIQIFLMSILSYGTEKESYFKVIHATDSTSYIQWGTNELVRQTKKTYPNWPVIERITKKTENDQYIVLQWWTGSDSQTLLILPLNKTSNEQELYNDVAFDLENELVVYEYGSRDTILVAENFRTNEKQYIGLDWESCNSAFPHYCIEDIEISDKVLYLTWTIPTKLNQNANRQRKKIKLTI